VALLERLQILIDADAKGAVREFDKAGQAADRLDAKLEAGAAKTSARLTSIGTKSLIGGAAVIGGLYKLAQASDEAEKQQLKLENSVKNSDQAFSNGGKALTDLATSLQQVTAADGDAIVGAESLLVQFGLTEDQVKKVTPLVVDLSRKLGIDLDSAAKMVGKSIGGSAGALKKAGIDIDATALKADSFGATIEALSGSVGGFATAEGKTFSGQLEILKNNLGDIGENVGKGAVSVFNGIAGSLVKITGSVGGANSQLGETAGRLGAIAGIGTTVVGSLSLVAGQAIKLRERFTTLGDDGSRSLNKVGVAAAALGSVFAVLAVAEVIGAVGNSLGNFAQKAEDALTRLQIALKQGTDAEIVNRFGNSVKAAQDELTGLGDVVESVGKEVRIGTVGIGLDIEKVDQTFRKLLNEGGVEAAQRLVDAINAQRAALDPTSQKYQDLTLVVERFQGVLNLSNEASRAGVGAQTDLAGATEEAKNKYQEFTDTITASVDPILGAINSTARLTEAKIATVEAQAKVTELERAGKIGTEEYAQAQDRLTQATANQVSAAFNNEKVLATVAAGLADGTIKTEDFAKALQQVVAAGGLTEAQAGQLLVKLGGVNAELGRLDGRVVSAEVKVGVSWYEKQVAGGGTIAGVPVPGLMPAAPPSPPKPPTKPPTKPKYQPGQRGPKRALGGPLAAGQQSMVNEMGAEMFVPSSSGFVMDSDDSKALVRGVEAMLAGGGGNTFNITTTDPMLSAAEIVRRQRDAQFLLGR
jgi:hypothetical protein